MRPPRVSVVMAAHNTEQWIDGAISSVLSQTFGDFELLIVDDGSTDRTLEIVTARAREDRRIRVIRPGRVGVVEARNLAIREARGEYIAIMDSDDLSMPNRFAKEVAFLDATPDAVGVTAEMRVVTHHRAVPADLSDLKIERHPATPGAHVDGFWLQYRTIFHGPAMLRRDQLLRAGLYRPHFRDAEDADLMLRLEELGLIGRLPECLYLRRQHLGNTFFHFPYAPIESTVLALLAARRRRQSGRDLPGKSGRPFWRLFRFGLTPAEIMHALVLTCVLCIRRAFKQRKRYRRLAPLFAPLPPAKPL